jgi:hypothetical protein
LYKAEPHGTENIFHIGQISALYKINNTDSSGRDYTICSHSANFRLIQVPPYPRVMVYSSVEALVSYSKTVNGFPLNLLQICTLKFSGEFHSDPHQLSKPPILHGAQ